MNSTTSDLLNGLFPVTDENKEMPFIGDEEDQLYLPDSIRKYFASVLSPMQALELFAKVKAQARLNPKSGLLDPPLLSGYIGEKSDWRNDKTLEPMEILKYIKDKGTNLSQATYEKLSKNLESIVLIAHQDIMVNLDNLNKGIDDFAILKTTVLNEARYNGGPIYPHILYATQPSISSKFSLGTGFFITEDTIATAFHVTNYIRTEAGENWLDKIVIISGYYLEGEEETCIRIPKEKIFRTFSNKPFSESDDYETDDWAYLKVRPAFGTSITPKPVKMSVKAAACGTDIYMLGHGLGLPAKLSWNGQVTKAKVVIKGAAGDIDKVTNLALCKIESFPGNSGSPVFDSETHEVVGIMKGYNHLIDFVEIPENGKMYHLPVCYLHGRYATQFTHISSVISRLGHP